MEYIVVGFSDVDEPISNHQGFLVMKFHLNIFFLQLLVLLGYYKIYKCLFNPPSEHIMGE